MEIFCTLEQLQDVYDILTTCKLELNVPAVQLFNFYSIAAMRQSLDLSVISLLGRNEGTCKIFAQYSAELTKSVADLTVFMPGILQTICASVTHVISRHLTDLGTIGRV